MNKLFKRNSASADKSPPSDSRRIVLATLTAGAIGAFLLALINIDRMEMFLLGAILSITLLLGHSGHIGIARWISLLITLTVLSLLVFRNNGIRDPAVLGLIVVLISAGLLAGQRGTLIFGALILGEIVVFGYLESRGVIVNQFSRSNHFADYFSIGLGVILVTALQWLVITRLNENIQSAEQELRERKAVEDQLRDAENRYRSLVEQIPAAIYISEPGREGKWFYVSPQIETMTGYKSEEWTSDPALWSRLIHPDDREKTIHNEIQAVRDGQMPRAEYRLQKRDGGYIWVQDQSLRSMDNNTLQGFLLDITTRKMAEDQLQKRLADLNAVRGVSEALVLQTSLQQLILQAGDQIRITFEVDHLFIALLDAATDQIRFPYYFEKGRYVQAPPLTFGKGLTLCVTKSKEPLLINEHWAETSAKQGVIYYDNNPAKSSLTMPLLIGERGIGAISIQNMERENVFTENDIRLLSTIAANLAVAIENARLQESLKRELTIQERLVEELERKNAELERFTYTASHDLKSPLITIRGYLGYLEQDARGGNFERLGQDVSRISEAVEKMHNLLSDLLELSRVGRVMNAPQEVPFREIVRESLRRLEGQLAAGQVKVKVESDLPLITGDKERLIEVVQNLVDNACKFMGGQKNPLIEIGANKVDGEHVFFVKDNGIGIQKKFRQKVFGLFDKLDPNSEGTGVGLALVKRIIEVHEGRIWIESEGNGKGTTFFFTLSEKTPS